MIIRIVRSDTTPIDETPAGVIYAYSDRRNGWYCYLHNADGDQLGAAIYDYNKSGILAAAKALSEANDDVPVKRG